MSATMIFCAYMAFVYMPWDIFVKPVAQDEEVWFGILFTGAWAKILAFPHWSSTALRSRLPPPPPWMAFWAPAYAAQVAFGMAVWPILQRGDAIGWIIGAAAGAVFAIPAVALWRARASASSPRLDRFASAMGSGPSVTGASSGIGAAFARALARTGSPAC